MSEVHRYSVVKMLSAEGNAISYSPHGPDVVMADAFDTLRQQLADVSNERDGLRNQCAGIYQQLGICQKQRDNRQDRLNASEARNAELCDLLQMFIENSDDGDVVDLSRHALAQSALATNPSTTSNLPDGPLTDEGTKSDYLQSCEAAARLLAEPATDEQGDD